MPTYPYNLTDVGAILPIHTPRQSNVGLVCDCSKAGGCRSPGKHPVFRLVKRGLLDATRDPEKAKDVARQNAFGNTALCTGKTVWRAPHSRLVIQGKYTYSLRSTANTPAEMPAGSTIAGWLGVLDVDPRNGGDESLAAFEAEFGRLPTSWSVVTGGLGQHYFYLFPQAPASGVLASGLELKGAGGYVVLAPSLHISGRQYHWEAGLGPEDAELVMAPQWLQTHVAAFGKGLPSPITRMPEVPSLMMRAFAQKGWLGHSIAGGGYTARCPWLFEHTDGRGDGQDSSTVLLPPSAETRTGAFYCHHSHCRKAGAARSTVRPVLSALELPISKLEELEREFPECGRLLRGPGLLAKAHAKERAAQPPAPPPPPPPDDTRPGRPPACRRLQPWHLDLRWREPSPQGIQHLHPYAANLSIILQHDPFFRTEDGRSRIRKNANLQAVTILGRPAVVPGDMSEEGVYRLDELTVQWVQRYLEYHYAMKLPTGDILTCVTAHAEHDVTRPLETWLRSLHWDGTARVDTWLSTYLGVVDTPYAKSVGRWWLISAVARAFVPGEQADAVLVLEGKQGKGKSTVFRILAETAQKGMTGMPEDTTLFLDSPLELGSKDAYESIRGKWIVELAEMTSIKRGDIDKQKVFLSSRIDSFRESYGRFSRDWKRTSVCGGSVNPDGLGYLRDPTGARRFWPVAIGDIDLRALRRDAPQLWAEATRLYQAGAVWYPTPEEQMLLEEEQAKRLNVLEDDDVWFPVVARALSMSGKLRLTLSDVFSRAFPDLPQHKIAHQDTIRVARILVKMGWRKVRQGGVGRSYCYVAPADWTERSRLYMTYPASSTSLLEDN